MKPSIKQNAKAFVRRIMRPKPVQDRHGKELRDRTIVPGGTILICDHVNSPSGHRAAHFMTVEEHLSTFKEVGFINPREICPAADLSLMAADKP